MGASAGPEVGPQPAVEQPDPELSYDAKSQGAPATSRLATPTRFARYLARPLAPSARYLDHGVLTAAVAGGFPHRYRLELGIGLLDHLSLGVTAHWLPGADTPNWSPKVAIAFYRWRTVEIGAHYFRSMYPPPAENDDGTTSFQRWAHWALASVSFSQAALSGGFDLGVVVNNTSDPQAQAAEGGSVPSRTIYRLGGGLHLRAGTRRWGFTANVLAPALFAELVFDVRFGLFEKRPRGGWKPSGVVWATDRQHLPAGFHHHR